MIFAVQLSLISDFLSFLIGCSYTLFLIIHNLIPCDRSMKVWEGHIYWIYRSL